jgi:hypothetical protein
LEAKIYSGITGESTYRIEQNQTVSEGFLAQTGSIHYFVAGLRGSRIPGKSRADRLVVLANVSTRDPSNSKRWTG